VKEVTNMRQIVRLGFLIVLALVLLVAMVDVAFENLSFTPIGVHFFVWTWDTPVATLVVASNLIPPRTMG
jgi:hypothetical protein